MKLWWEGDVADTDSRHHRCRAHIEWQLSPMLLRVNTEGVAQEQTQRKYLCISLYVQEKYQAREAILEMRENAVAAKEAQALSEEAAHASSPGQACPDGATTEPMADDSKAGSVLLRLSPKTSIWLSKH